MDQFAIQKLLQTGKERYTTVHNGIEIYLKEKETSSPEADRHGRGIRVTHTVTLRACHLCHAF